jgi:hypothetical protein
MLPNFKHLSALHINMKCNSWSVLSRRPLHMCVLTVRAFNSWKWWQYFLPKAWYPRSLHSHHRGMPLVSVQFPRNECSMCVCVCPSVSPLCPKQVFEVKQQSNSEPNSLTMKAKQSILMLSYHNFGQYSGCLTALSLSKVPYAFSVSIK